MECRVESVELSIGGRIWIILRLFRYESEKQMVRSGLNAFLYNCLRLANLEALMPEKAFHLTLVSVQPMEHNAYSGIFTSTITAEDLF